MIIVSLMNKSAAYRMSCGLIVQDIIDPIISVYEKLADDIYTANNMENCVFSARHIIQCAQRNELIDLIGSIPISYNDLLKEIKQLEDAIVIDELKRLDFLDKNIDYIKEKKHLIFALKTIKYQLENARDISSAIIIDTQYIHTAEEVCQWIYDLCKYNRVFDDVFSDVYIKDTLKKIYENCSIDDSLL
jgi:hypothetical protein